MKRFSVIPILILAFLLISFTENNTQESNDKEFIVVLDAGHGGHDPGNLGNGYLEKNIALNIVFRVGSILEKNPNIKVIYTRKKDVFVDLFARGEIANKANADLFVSVHCDSHSSDAHGAGTFVLGLHANEQNFEIAKKENSVIYLEDDYESKYSDYDINSPESVIGLTIMQEEFLDQSIALAKAIQDNFSNKLKRKDRKVKQAGFIVLHQTFMPSVLVETGFLTNDDEGAYLNSWKGQSEMGNAIANAILNYKKGVQSNTVAESSKVSMPSQDSEKVEDIASIEKTMDKSEVLVKKEMIAAKLSKEQAQKPALQKVARKIVEKSAPEENKKETGAAPSKGSSMLFKDSGKVGGVASVEKTIDMSAIVDEKEIKAAKLAKEQPQKPALQKVARKIVEKPAPVEKKKEEVVKTKSELKETISNVVFKVQLMASKKKIPLTPKYFNGLNVLSEEKYKDFNRYMYGDVNTYEAAKLLKTNANKKGYTSSYIVAYKGRERITVKQAMKYVSEY